MHRSIRASAAVLATGLVLIACGTASDTDSGAAPSTEPATAPATEPALAPVDTAAPSAAAPDSAPATDDAAAVPADAATEEPVESEPTAAGEEPAATEAPPQSDAPAPPQAEAALGGRSFASELAADSDFAENMLPDLQVDDIRSGAKVNLRNVFPAERPVLFWMWAPH